MPVEPGKTRVKLHGYCSVEEAETLFEWLHNHDKATVQVGDMAHPHAAVLQALMAGQPKTNGIPSDEFTADCIRQAYLLTHLEQAK